MEPAKHIASAAVLATFLVGYAHGECSQLRGILVSYFDTISGRCYSKIGVSDELRLIPCTQFSYVGPLVPLEPKRKRFCVYSTGCDTPVDGAIMWDGVCITDILW